MWLYSDQWAAGFFDGEGCVSIQNNVRRSSGYRNNNLYVYVTQRVLPPLTALKDEFGGCIKRSNPDCWQWVVSATRAEIFLRRIQPHVLVKAAVIEMGLAYRKLFIPMKGRSGRKLSPEIASAREALRQKLSDFNQRR